MFFYVLLAESGLRNIIGHEDVRSASQHVLTTASLECKWTLGAKFYFKSHYLNWCWNFWRQKLLSSSRRGLSCSY